MSPKTQTIIGIALILVAAVTAITGASKNAWVGLLTVFIGVVGGQLLGQAYKRTR